VKIHEYQAKDILARYGVPIQPGRVAHTPEEAEAIARELGGPVVIKAQVYVGGRGKAGGIQFGDTPAQARTAAAKVLGMDIKGLKVEKVLVVSKIDIKEEYYLGIILDRKTQAPIVMVSKEGGIDIEEVAAKTPEQIFKETIDPAVGFRPFQARKLAFALGLPGALVSQAAKFMQSLYSAYEAMDASLLEINPFLLTKDNRLIALDAKVNFDDNALFRHPEFKDLRDLHEEEPLEIEASKFDLNYIKLDGNIACMVNGAGLAMATMDIIKLAGGEPANFLDVGGGASQERVEAGFRILLADPNVRAVLVNIFGGIVRCDMVARGVVGAAKNLGVKVPVVVRLEGTNVEEGQRVIRESGLNFAVAKGMKDAADKVVALAG